jgi:ClpP class serine protease
MSQEINYARKARDIKGIVLMVNSPAGASSGHDIYFQLRKLRAEKPVVASVDICLPAPLYQIAVAATEIYAKPALSHRQHRRHCRPALPRNLERAVYNHWPI